MAGRLLHSLVFSSVLALESAGCTVAHAPLTDAGGGDPPDGGSDAGTDAGFDAGSDAGFDAGDVRFCEPGWPTTKAMICVDQPDGTTECCSTLLPDGSPEACCIGVREP